MNMTLILCAFLASLNAFATSATPASVPTPALAPSPSAPPVASAPPPAHGPMIPPRTAAPKPSDLFQMSSLYSPGQFNVSVFGAPQGLVDRVSTAYLAAGAKKIVHTRCPACPYTTVEFDNDKTQAIIIDPPGASDGSPGGGPIGMNYQWNFGLTMNDGISVNYMGATLGFSGPVAATLYLGLSKSGAQVVGQTKDAKGDFTVPIYSVVSPSYVINCRQEVPLTICELLIK